MGQQHFSGASIGIATAMGPDDSVDRLLRDADAAMYEAKKYGGRGRYVIFDEAIRNGLVTALNQEMALRHAQAKKDFLLWMQPIYQLAGDESAASSGCLRSVWFVGSVVKIPFFQVSSWPWRNAREQL